jgi:hypothetical protein
MSWPDTSNTSSIAFNARSPSVPYAPPGPASPRKNHEENSAKNSLNASLNSIGAARSTVLLLDPDLGLDEEADSRTEAAGETDSLLGPSSALPSPRRNSKMAGEAHHDATPLLRAVRWGCWGFF